MALLQFTDSGIYCAQADVYIDPWRPVKKALITHAHADHSRWGMQHYLAHFDSLPIMRHRLGDIQAQGIAYGEALHINGVQISFHPAGHIPGSAQIRLEYQGETWVVSGDYKLEDDGLCTPFEAVACQHFITESTFGLPVYRWPKQHEVFDDINAWWRSSIQEGKVCVVGVYSLGKAQRVMQGLDGSIGKIFTHGAVENTNEVLREQGIFLPHTELIRGQDKREFTGGLVLCPPSALNTPWMRKLGNSSTAFCSGWMSLRGTRRRRSADRGFVLSDHADWPGLIEAVKATRAENVYVTHGYKDVFARYLREELKLNAQVVDTLYQGDEADEPEAGAST